ncbi:hypothetical protein SERLA73DRAFT_158738 [Serpula lacrymans var. lacrymans S7.3]|uniref:Uncharacterized protein n=2 Tax=Serpula lacrymans var. lacrymans TaxID=341189 RepID=F8PPJ1_SERL3|nr:uncharacterized protein SERLADRAFT_413605 [Serpula lacrymans var. lacrymans S7.9]EGO01410.1 hypothetical protein SERLA73DRAFT_158738 [Serpula lacrymans var. lacrymans S7.3]EGO27043.1 hypothetical protein SERLADRAFT_413605 [Serpula lacrymans var. lacrymans S7.9]
MSSPFSSVAYDAVLNAPILGTNRAPSDLDAWYAQNLLTTLGPMLDGLCKPKDCGHGTSHAEPNLKGKRREFAELVGNLRALLSPARRLPPEVIAIIFTHCILHDEPLSPVSSQPPLILGRVCKVWREVVLSTRGAWTSLAIRFPPSVVSWDIFVEKNLFILETWLQRSGSLPMSLALVSHGHLPSSTIDRFTRMLCLHSHRWRSLNLFMASDDLTSLLEVARYSLPALENVIAHDSDEIVTPGGLNLRLHSTPNLTTVSFTAYPLRPGQIVLNWAQLTELSLLYDARHRRYRACTNYHHILAQCLNLEICSLGIGDASSPGMPSTILLHRLRILRLRRLEPRSRLSGLIDALTLPQLEELEYDSTIMTTALPWWRDKPFPGQVYALLSRSECKLKTLCIKYVDFSGAELLQCLVNMPYLKTLWYTPFPHLRSISKVVNALAKHDYANHNSSMWLPNLNQLHLACTSLNDFDSVVNMVKLRSGEASLARLRQFELSFFDFEKPEPRHEREEIKLAEVRSHLWECAQHDRELFTRLNINVAANINHVNLI